MLRATAAMLSRTRLQRYGCVSNVNEVHNDSKMNCSPRKTTRLRSRVLEVQFVVVGGCLCSTVQIRRKGEGVVIRGVKVVGPRCLGELAIAGVARSTVVVLVTHRDQFGMAVQIGSHLVKFSLSGLLYKLGAT